MKWYNEHVDQHYEAQKEGDEQKIKLLEEKLSQGHHALARCEEKCAFVEESSTDIRIGEDFEIELEDARSVDGKNAFDAREVKHVTVGGGRETPPPPERIEPPHHVKHPIPKPIAPPEKPKEEISTGGGQIGYIEPPKPFLPLFVTPGEALIHIMFSSKCPDHVGSPGIRTNDNRTLKAEVVSDNKFVDTSISGNNTPSPSVDVKFNCNVPGTGTYNETVKVKVTDTQSGESKTLDYNATITVKK